MAYLQFTNESFAICSQNCDVQVLYTGAAERDTDAKQFITIQAGFLVKVKEVVGKLASIRIYDFYSKNLTFENNLFTCSLAHLHKVQPNVWPYLIAIVDPVQRLGFFRNPELISYVLSIKISDLVTANVAALYLNGKVLDCIVRYIGLVSEIGPGFYFGLEIMGTQSSEFSPQCEKYGSFIEHYVPGYPELALIVPANLLELPEDRRGNQSHDKPKDFLTKFISNTVEKVEKARNEFSNRTSTLRRSKHSLPERRDSVKRSSWTAPEFLTIPAANQPTMDRPNIANSVSNPNLRRDDDSSDKSSSTKSSQTTNASNSSNSDTRRGKKKVVVVPAITNVKPNTILSLEDRDLIIIDRHDIDMSISHESEVIVLDNPRSIQTQAANEVDLIDILGRDWPASAGDTAFALNAEKRPNGSTPLKPIISSNNDRNKSLNIISHLKNTKYDKPRGKENTTSRGSDLGSASSSFDSSQSGGSILKKKSDAPLYDNLSAPDLVSLSSPDENFNPVPLSEVPNSSHLGIGSMVEVQADNSDALYGVIQWIGLTVPGNPKSCLVGVELDDEPVDRPLKLNDGTYSGVRLFKCPPNRGIFVTPLQCVKDRRFQELERQASTSMASSSVTKVTKQIDNFKMFGQKDCPVVPGFVPPLKILAPSDLEKVCGKFKGIQGHHNSCYLDATLFAMFTFTCVFDSLLFRPPDPNDIAHYEEVQTVLRDEIVNPLRKNLFVRADRVMKLRKLLDRLSSVTGLLSEEKDPEEFLNSLLAQILRVEPFLKLSSGQDTFYYQLFVEKDERLSFPSVQQLFEQSFLASDIKLKEVPSCLIIQMPRFGKNYKMYNRILPSQVLDVTHIIEDSPRPCSVCNKLAAFECKDCFGTMNCVDDFESTAFCKSCLERTHTATRQNHATKEISVPDDFRRMNANNCISVPHLFMELFAVVCIETSHYVAFVKAGSGQDAPWCFFDSMADRKGEQNGYNIPEMVSVTELSQWLSEDGARDLNEAITSDKMLPEHAKRLFCDAYMCMYQSTDVMMYR